MSLLAYLKKKERPVSADRIHRDMEAFYPDDPASFRRQFERDKDDLRNLGIPIAMESVLDGEQPVDGYLVHDKDYQLVNPGLTSEELAALSMAAHTVSLGARTADSALWKLGGSTAPPARPVASIATHPLVSELFRAIQDRRVVRFDYGAVAREVEPWRMAQRNGNWLLVGFDRTKNGRRNFRIDRIEGAVELGDADSAPAVPDDAAAAEREPWQFDDAPAIVARVLVDPDRADLAVVSFGEAAVEARRDDGSVVLSLNVTSIDGFRSVLLGYGTSAEVLDPPELRADVIAWLEAMVAAT